MIQNLKSHTLWDSAGNRTTEVVITEHHSHTKIWVIKVVVMKVFVFALQNQHPWLYTKAQRLQMVHVRSSGHLDTYQQKRGALNFVIQVNWFCIEIFFIDIVCLNCGIHIQLSLIMRYFFKVNHRPKDYSYFIASIQIIPNALWSLYQTHRKI